MIYDPPTASNTIGGFVDTTNYLQVGNVQELKRRITIRKYDADGNVTEETVTEEYGDKEIISIPSYPQPISPSSPWQYPTITCGTAGGINTN